MLVYYFVPFIVSNRYLLSRDSNGHNSVTVQNRTHVCMNFFDHKDLGNHLLQLCPKVVKHPVYVCTYVWCKHVCVYSFIYSFIHGSLHHTVSISAYTASNDRTISKRQIEKWKLFERGHCLNWRITCHLLGVTKKYDKILSEESQYPAWDLNQAPHIHKSEALLLQPNCPIGW